MFHFTSEGKLSSKVNFHRRKLQNAEEQELTRDVIACETSLWRSVFQQPTNQAGHPPPSYKRKNLPSHYRSAGLVVMLVISIKPFNFFAFKSIVNEQNEDVLLHFYTILLLVLHNIIGKHTRDFWISWER